jgi:hypothetical protein
MELRRARPRPARPARIVFPLGSALVRNRDISSTSAHASLAFNQAY